MNQEIRLALPSEFDHIHQLILEYMDPDFTFAHFEWKHIVNPNGQSICVVFLENNEIIGFNFLSPYYIKYELTNLKFYRISEVLVLPQGRGKGVFTRIEEYVHSNFISFCSGVFATPNSNSINTFKKIGWTMKEIPTSFFVNIPLKYTSHVVFTSGKDYQNKDNHTFEEGILYDFKWRINVDSYKVADYNKSIVIYEVIKKNSFSIIKLLYKIGDKNDIKSILSTIQIKEKALIFIDRDDSFINHIYKRKSSSYDFGYMLFDKSINPESMTNLQLSLGDLDKIF